MYYPVPSHAQTQTHTPHAGIRVLAIVIARTARRVYIRTYNCLHLAIRATPCITISLAPHVPGTITDTGALTPAGLSPGEWIPCHQRARIFTAGQGAARTRTLAAAAPAPAPDGAVVAGPIPVKVSGGEGSTRSRRSLLQRREEPAVARAQEEAAPGGIHAHRTVNLSTRGGNIKEKRVDSALSSSSALPASPPPARYHAAPT
ncbi:hypothetical protein B0H13DRAFT_2682004 [Mycena leptocephala]|nr:hypothetical protein B0H13DRAFT_2682004 [Mycena leptocephala]